MNESGNGRAAGSLGVNSALFVTLGFVFALVSLFYQPFIFGVLGVVMGILAARNGGRAGVSVIIASIVLMGVGLFYSGPLLNYARHLFGL